MNLGEFEKQIANRRISNKLEEISSLLVGQNNQKAETARDYIRMLTEWQKYTKAETFNQLKIALPISYEIAIKNIHHAYQDKR